MSHESILVGVAIVIIAFFVELFMRPKSGKTRKSRYGIELKERVERHDNIIRLPAASSGPTPVIIV